MRLSGLFPELCSVKPSANDTQPTCPPDLAQLTVEKLPTEWRHQLEQNQPITTDSPQAGQPLWKTPGQPALIAIFPLSSGPHSGLLCLQWVSTPELAIEIDPRTPEGLVLYQRGANFIAQQIGLHQAAADVMEVVTLTSGITQESEPLPKSLLGETTQPHHAPVPEHIFRNWLRQSRDSFRSLFFAASDPMIVYDIQPGASYGWILHANQAASELTGYSQIEFQNLNITALRSTTASEHNSNTEQKLQVGTSIEQEETLLHKDGSQTILEVHTQLITLIGRPMALATGRDITQRKQQQQEKELLMREINHRINNNLQGIMGLLEREALYNPGAALALERAKQQILTIQIVNSLQHENSGSIELWLLVQTLVENHQGSTPVPIQATCLDNSSHSVVSSNESVQTALILNELLTNAIKHTPNDPLARIAVHFSIANSAVHITIENGPAQLPPEFDLSETDKLGSGLSLICFLLGAQTGNLTITHKNNRVISTLTLYHR